MARNRRDDFDQLLRALGLDDDSLGLGTSEEQLVPAQPEIYGWAPLGEQPADNAERSVGRVEGGINAIQRGVRGAPQAVSNLGATLSSRQVSNAQDERGLLDRVFGAIVADPTNPIDAAAGAYADYASAVGTRLALSKEELGQEEAENAATITRNEAALRALNERFPQSAAAQQFQRTEGLWNALTEEGGVGNALSAVVESTGESLVRSAPAIGLATILRGRGAPAILGADAAAQEYSAGILDYLNTEFPGLTPAELEAKLLEPGVRERALAYAGTRAKVVGAGTFAGSEVAGALLPKPGATAGQFARNVLVTQPATQLAMDAGVETTAQAASRGSLDAKDIFLEAAGGAVTAPIDVAGQVLGRIDDNRKAEEQRILEARERARKMNTPTAENIATAFEAGIRDAADSGPQQLDLELPGADEIAPSVGGAIEAETTTALESELAARQPQPVTPRNRLSREADALRSTIETAAEAPETLNEVEQANVADSIDRLNEIESRIENIDREPTQPDLFNVVTDPNIGAIEDTRRKIADDDAKAKAKAEEKRAMKEQADLRKFRTDFLRSNPEATNEQVLAAESAWRASRTAAPAPVATTKTKAPAIATAPSVKPEEDSESFSAALADILRQPRKGRTVGPKAAADLSGIEVDDGDADFDPSEIEEADIRAIAENNPNLRRHLSGTGVRPVLYHGTNKSADITVWKPAAGQMGAHMSASPDGVAKQFAERASDGGKMMRLAVNIKNPVRLRDDGAWAVPQVVPQLAAMGKLTPEQAESYQQQEEALLEERAAILVGTELTPEVEAAVEDVDRRRNELAAQAVKDAGHDGVLYQNRYEVPGLTREELFQRMLDNGIRPVQAEIEKLSDGEFKALFPETENSIIALDSTQVKDVDNNSGEYDSTNPNIKAAADMRSYRKNLADKTEAFPPMSAERRLIEAHATATTPAKRIAAAFEFIEDTLGNTVNDQFLRNFVLPALRKLAPLIRDITIYPDKQSLQYDGGMARGLFFPDTGKIEIARGGMSAKVMIHEMLHAATWGALRNPKFVESDANVAAAVAGINKVRDLVQAWVDNGGVKRLPDGEAKQLLTKGVGRLIDAKGNVDIDELITYIFTEPSIQQAFRQIKAPGMLRNAWRTAVDSIRKFLGLKEKDYDAVDAMLVEGTELLRALSDNPNSPTSRETISTTEFRRFGDGTLDMAADAAEATAPKASAAPVDTRAPVDVATKLVSKRSIGGMGVDTATGKTATGLRARINTLLRGKRWAGPEATTEVLVNADGLTAAGMIELRVQYDEMRKLVADNGSKFFDKKGDHWEKFITMMDNFENAKTEEEKNIWFDDLRNAFGQRTLDILENMRTQIDERSMDLIHQLYDDAPVDSDGNKIISKDLTRQLNAIAANIGKYNHRSYAIFDKKLAEQHRLWLSKTGPGRVVYDRAVKFLTKNDVSIPADDVLDTMSREALERRAAVWTTTKEGLPLEDLRNGLRAVRDNPQAYNKDTIDYNAIGLAEDIINNRKTNATRIYLSERADQTILKKREDVPKELRALMGENADPGFRVLQTVLKQDKLLNKLKAFREISDRFNGTYVFDNRNDAPSNFVQLGATDLGALANKFVHPDVAAALETTTVTLTTLEQMFDNPQNLTAGIAQGAGKAVRGLKGFILLTSGLGYAFNLAGSFLTILANGHAAKLVTNPGVMKEALQTIIENNRALATGKFTPRVEEMFRRVINDPAMTGEMQQISIADAVARVYEREAIDSARNRFQKYVKGPVGWAWDRMFDLYAAMDMWAKVYNYYAEVAEVRGLNELLPADQKMDEERVRRTAAERVRQSNLSYERAFPAVRTLDQTGITLFSTYTAEVFRSLGAGASLVNSDMQLASEMEAAGNTEAAAYLRKMAAKRAAGLAGVTLAGSIAGKAVTSGVVSLMIMAGVLGEADYDEEEEEAIIAMARIGTPWLADRDVGVAAVDPKTGKPVVMDMGRGNPYDPAVNAMRLIGQGDVLGAAKSTAGGISPLLSFGMGLEGSRSRTPRTVREGGPVATAVARLSASGTVSRDYSYFLLNLAEMYAPTQLEEALIKDDFTLADGLGYRPVTADPIKYLGRGGLGREIADIRNELSDNLKNLDVLRDDAMLDDTAAQAAARELEMFRRASTAVGLARQLGVPEKDIKDALEGASVRRDVARGLRRENFVPSILSEEVLNRAREDAIKESPDDKTEINARFRELKRKLRERRRQALLEEKE